MSDPFSSSTPSPANDSFNRRSFLHTAGATAAATALWTGAGRGQGIDPSKKLKIGFIGTGGRGTGAAEQALTADDNCELYAMADVFQERIDLSLENLNKRK
ncbi:MAG: twin-arginine translocation signal domain-containing protein, partial [Verrucomicrobiae bacterium]|nr:twin-arginine translocation signal domain-containing protein [Verrucomicrobiae bacterium]